MDGHPVEPARWSPRRWISTIVVLVVVQVGLIFYLGERVHSKPVARSKRTFGSQIYLAINPLSEEQLARLPTLSDPLVFALASPNGFSGPAWFNFQPLRYELTNWTEPPRWLVPNSERLGLDLVQFVATNAPFSLPLPERGFARSSGWEIYVLPQSLPTRSELRVEPNGAGRTLLGSYDLPSLRHSDLLSNSVVQVLVDAAGHALSATPLEESGLREADDYALKLASTARFVPLPVGTVGGAIADTNGLAWVRLVFQWHTLPLSATNRIPARARE